MLPPSTVESAFKLKNATNLTNDDQHKLGLRHENCSETSSSIQFKSSLKRFPDEKLTEDSTHILSEQNARSSNDLPSCPPSSTDFGKVRVSKPPSIFQSVPTLTTRSSGSGLEEDLRRFDLVFNRTESVHDDITSDSNTMHLKPRITPKPGQVRNKGGSQANALMDIHGQQSDIVAFNRTESVLDDIASDRNIINPRNAPKPVSQGQERNKERTQANAFRDIYGLQSAFAFNRTESFLDDITSDSNIIEPRIAPKPVSQGQERSKEGSKANAFRDIHGQQSDIAFSRTESVLDSIASDSNTMDKKLRNAPKPVYQGQERNKGGTQANAFRDIHGKQSDIAFNRTENVLYDIASDSNTMDIKLRNAPKPVYQGQERNKGGTQANAFRDTQGEQSDNSVVSYSNLRAKFKAPRPEKKSPEKNDGGLVGAEKKNKLIVQDRQKDTTNTSMISTDMMDENATKASSKNIRTNKQTKKKTRANPKYKPVPSVLSQIRGKTRHASVDKNEAKTRSNLDNAYKQRQTDKKRQFKEKDEKLFPGYEKLNHETHVIVTWSIPLCEGGVTTNEVDKHTACSLALQNLIGPCVSYVITNTRPIYNHCSGQQGIATMLLKSKHDAKLLRDSINSNSTVTNLEASVQTIHKSEVCALINAFKEIINAKVDTPVTDHVLKMDEIQAEIDRLKDGPRTRNFAEVGEVMQEIAASEHKLKELFDQRNVFKGFVDTVMKELDDLLFVAHNIEAQAEKIHATFQRELKRFKTALPMYARKEDIIALLENNQVSIIIGETGSGKSTQLAQYLYEATHQSNPTIAVTQPRKVAATSLAKRVSEEMGSALGQIVGYNVGMNQALSAKTCIKFMTDHSLLKECLKDRTLSAYSCIIVDEAHERSIYTDLLLAMIKKILPKRPELKVVITSATIDPKLFVEYFGTCPVMKVSGRAYPVNVIYDTDDNVDEYLRVAVDKTYQVHHQYPPGDILVFLTSPLETEKACDQLIAKMKNQDVLILPLHGQLHAKEQNKVFDKLPPNKRKIIFATNCAETSLTIDGIKYVIDAGFVKERVYDTKRSVNALKLVRITQSSAEQRKGRAGRTQSGTCFRLFTEETYADFRPNTTPEIMTMHLGQAFLSLMALDVRDPLSFEFVESPGVEALTKALELLENLGAVEDGVITELGKKLAKLSLEPRLGKMLLQGIEKDIAREAVIVAAIYSTGVNLFFRPKNEEEKENADKLKTLFCKAEGDLITYLGVYKTWDKLPDKDKNRWCINNSMNAKSARIIRDSVREIGHTLKNELKIDVPKCDAEAKCVYEMIPQLLLGSYSSNIAMYLDAPKAGYVLPFDENRIATIHPSSALQYLDTFPQWIIFESLLTTSRDFLINVTAVDKALIESAAAEGTLDVDLSKLAEFIVSPCRLETYFGKKTMGDLIGPKYTKLKALEEQIAKKTDSFVSIQKDEDCSMNILIPARFHPDAKAMLTEKVESIRGELRKDSIQIDVAQNSGVRMAVCHGCKIGHFLLPNQYIAIFIESAPSNWNEGHMKEHFSTCGEILKCVKFQSKSSPASKKPQNWGVVTFKTHDDAQKAMRLVKADPDQHIRARPDCLSRDQNINFLMPFCFKIEWVRRPPRGSAIIKVRDPDYFETCAEYLGSLRICGQKVYPGKHNPQELFAPRLPSTVTAKEVIQSISSQVGITGYLRENDVIFPRAKAYADTLEHVNFKDHLATICTEMKIPADGVDIFVRQPKEKDFTLTAFLRLAEPSKLRALRINLRSTTFNGRQMTLEESSKTTCMFRKEVYRAVKKDLDAAIERLTETDDSSDSEEEEDYSRTRITLDQLRNDMYRLTITAEKVEMLQTSREIITGIVSGLDLPAKKEFLSYCSTHDGKKMLKSIQDSCKVYVFANFSGLKLSIYGTTENKSMAEARLKIYMKAVEKLRIAEIGLQSMPGVIKVLFKKYGFTLEDLARKVKAGRIELVLRRRILHFQGTEDSLAKLKQELEDCFQGQPATNESHDYPDCPICFMTVEKDEKYVLECCGHMYCTDCVQNLIRNGISEKKFPITCAAEGCNEGISILDLKNLIGSTPTDLADLIKASIDDLVSQSGGKYKYCVTPDCDAVYKATELKYGARENKDEESGFNSTAVKCYKCDIVLCSTCGVEYHTGISCFFHQGRKSDEDYDMKVYMQRHKVLTCKRCFAYIQKSEGCDHITCKCGAHLCWKCHEMFDTGDETYRHQIRCPGKPSN